MTFSLPEALYHEEKAKIANGPKIILSQFDLLLTSVTSLWAMRIALENKCFNEELSTASEIPHDAVNRYYPLVSARNVRCFTVGNVNCHDGIGGDCIAWLHVYIDFVMMFASMSLCIGLKSLRREIICTLFHCMKCLRFSVLLKNCNQ